jgi:hypothetical protein
VSRATPSRGTHATSGKVATMTATNKIANQNSHAAMFTIIAPVQYPSSRSKRNPQRGQLLRSVKKDEKIFACPHRGQRRARPLPRAWDSVQLNAGVLSALTGPRALQGRRATLCGPSSQKT